MLIIFKEHVLRSEGDGWHLSLHLMTLGTRSLVIIMAIAGIYVRKDSKSVSTSLSISLVFFERRSSSYRVIRSGILASYANMSKRKGALSILKDSSSMIYRIGPPFAFLCPVAGMVPKPRLVQLFLTSLAAVSHRSLVVLS